ncbi:MAG: hypothetical protein ACXAC8_18500 [Candidatus Hodarchaeales archaeon]|jgi:hypothetical protein
MSSQNFQKALSVCVFFVIVVLSGCVYNPRTALKKELSRISNSEEELAVINFLEKYDFLEFTGLDYDDDGYFRFHWDNQFVCNISDLLVSAETNYNERTNYFRGEILYHIASSNVSFSEREDISILNFGAFKGSEGNCSIFDEDKDNPIPLDFWALMNLPDWFWVCTIDFQYILEQNYQLEEYYFTEIIIVTPTLKVLGLMSDFGHGGWVA